MRPTRRTLLSAALLALLPRRGFAFGGTGAVGFLDLGVPNPRPGALPALLRQVRANTSSKVETEVTVVRPEDPELFSTPMVYAAGDEAIPPLSASAIESLRLFVEQGGTVLLDDTSGRADGAFARSTRAAFEEILRGARWRVLPTEEHAVYRSFFLLTGSNAAGRVSVRPFLEGMDIGDVTSVVLSRNDLGGAWETDALGLYRFEVEGGSDARREALKLGINLVIFGLTGNYKTDAVHTENLLREMQDRRFGR